MQSYSLTLSAARFLQSVAPDVVPSIPEHAYRVRVNNGPRTRQALAQALERARARGIRSSLRAALARFDPEAVPSRRAPGARTGGRRLFVLFKRYGARTYKVQGTATAEGSAGTLYWLTCAALAPADERPGRVRVVEATTAAHARDTLARFERGEHRPAMLAGDGTGNTDPKGARVLGLGAAGALAVWTVLGPSDRCAWTGEHGAALAPEVFEELARAGAQ